MTSRVVLVAVMTGALLADLSGQQPQPTSQPIFRSRTDLVQVDAVVIDAEGRPMLGLKKSDFVLVDRKTQQVIDAFEEVSHSPISAPVFPATLKMDVADNATALSSRLVILGLDDLHIRGKTQAVRDMARKVVEQIGPSASPAAVEDDRAREVKYQVHTRLSLSPGHYQIRASASSAQLNRSGSVYLDVDVPDFGGESVGIVGVMIGHSDGARIFNMESPLVKGMVPFEPTLDREFSATESLRVFTRLSGAAASACTPVVSIARPEGVAVRSVAVQQNAGAIDTIVPLNDLLPGSYVLRVSCGVAPDAVVNLAPPKGTPIDQ